MQFKKKLDLGSDKILHLIHNLILQLLNYYLFLATMQLMQMKNMIRSFNDDSIITFTLIRKMM